MKNNEILIRYHDLGYGIQELKPNPKGDWIDLATAEPVKLDAGEFKLINLGVSMQLPKGYEAHLIPRSSTFARWGIIQTNGMGLIDNSYWGDFDVWKMPAYATRQVMIPAMTRIAQFRIVPIMGEIEITPMAVFNTINRGGFGSTGR